MEKEEFKKPHWVEVVEKKYNPVVHQLIGNMCGSVIQGFLHVVGLDYELAEAIYDEMYCLLKDNEPNKDSSND